MREVNRGWECQLYPGMGVQGALLSKLPLCMRATRGKLAVLRVQR